MFYFSCKTCDRVLAFADGELATALHCPESHDSVPNRVGAVATKHGDDVVAWVDAHPRVTGEALEAFYGARTLEEERALNAPATTRERLHELLGDHQEHDASQDAPSTYEPPRARVVGSMRDLAPKDASHEETTRKAPHEPAKHESPKPSKPSKSHR